MSASDPFFAEPAALMGDPARANILAALLDGRALTAKELAFAAGVTPQTTSGHLARLTAANLLTTVAQGRHRYFRLAGPAVARAIEALMALAGEATPRLGPEPARAPTWRPPAPATTISPAGWESESTTRSSRGRRWLWRKAATA